LPSLKSLANLTLVTLGLSFAAANLWYAASRSTIPLELHGEVTRKQQLLEKHPGLDDVCMITLSDGRQIHVDAPVYNAVTEGQSIDKQNWSHEVEIGGEKVGLTWSPDFLGMLWAMPITIAVFALLGMTLLDRPRAGAAVNAP
jgi:hypothetical protein